MKILVTGASGFLGQAITRHLIKHGHYVVAAGRSRVMHCHEFFDLPDIEETNWRFLTEKSDCIIHLAAIAHTRGISIDRLRAINYEPVVALARAIAPDQKVLFMSSIRAQGRGLGGASLVESDAATPEDEYGRMKLEAEQKLALLSPQACILRPVTVYGPGVKAGMRHLAQLLESNLPLPFGGLIARRSYLSIETLAEAVCFAINKSLNGIYNLSDSEPISLSELARWYREGQGRSPHLFKLPEGILLAGSSMLGLHALAKLAIEPLPVSAEKLRNAGFVQTFTSSRQSIEAWAQSQS